MYAVLAVDDEVMIKKTVRKLLEGLPSFRMAGEAEDGEEALAFIERVKPDVVVTDITMPVMDGLELIARLQRAAERPEIVILSGYDDFPYVQEAIRQGVADYLLKPIKPDEFRATMERVAGRLREKEAPRRNDWLPLCEAAGKRLAESAWLLRAEELDGPLEELRSRMEGRFGAESKAYGHVWADLVTFVSSELERRGGGELPLAAAAAALRTSSDADAACRMAKEAILEGMERIRQSRNWVNHRQIQTAIEAVNARFADPGLSMQELADAASMSPAYFSRSFKAEAGVTFVQYVTQLRMERVKELLGDAALSTNDAARAAGFSDYPHFTKAFKRYYGVSPTEYRKRLGIQ